jgi:predicted enzyme related to lactoylglutathione lyase
MRPTANRVVHLEFHTGDLAHAREFFARICGWSAERVDTRNGSYLALELGGGLSGGIVECLAPSVRCGCPTSRWPRSARPPAERASWGLRAA